MTGRDEALRELAEVFAAIAEEYRDRGMDLPAELPYVGRAGCPRRVV
jgi:hypothetical protein